MFIQEIFRAISQKILYFDSRYRQILVFGGVFSRFSATFQTCFGSQEGERVTRGSLFIMNNDTTHRLPESGRNRRENHRNLLFHDVLLVVSVAKEVLSTVCPCFCLREGEWSFKGLFCNAKNSQHRNSPPEPSHLR